jgi:two-component system OmpR family response regulator
VPEKDRILVVDDEPYITDLLSTGLEFEGFAVEVATTGTEAMHKVRTTKPDLVLLDVMLPDIEGIDIARRWRDEGQVVPVLFLTARDATEAGRVGVRRRLRHEAVLLERGGGAHPGRAPSDPP